LCYFGCQPVQALVIPLHIILLSSRATPSPKMEGVFIYLFVKPRKTSDKTKQYKIE